MDMKSLEKMAPWDWPEGSDTAILKVLQDKGQNVEDRFLAAELAGDFVVLNDDLGRELIAIATDENESEGMRSRAAVSFGVGLAYADENGFEDEEDILVSEPVYRQMQQVLKDLYLDHGNSSVIRRSALEASVRSPEHWHEDAVRTAYESSDPDWKLTGVFCMKFVKGFDNEIVASLKSENKLVQVQAVEAAGTWSVAGAAPFIIGLLEEGTDDKELLLAAIEAAPFVSPDEAATLLGELSDHDDEEIAEAASEALTYARGGMLDLDGDDEFDDEDEDEDEFDEDEDEFAFEDEDEEEDEEDK